MVLQNEIRKKIAERAKASTISKAIAHQNRIRFHCETALSESLTRPLNDFLAWVSNILPSDKFKTFQALFRYPLCTNEVTGKCFDKLSRIFDGRNPSINYQFLKTEQKDDWEYYRQEILHEPQIWQTKGWEYFKTEPNSILVVDMPSDAVNGTLPEPYFYWLPIANVIDYAVDPKTDLMQYVIFGQDDEIIVIDDYSYRRFTKGKNSNIDMLIADNPHGLGFCPCKFFVNDGISISNAEIKQSPITKVLELLDWLLFFHISKRHLDLYGAYPIYSGYEPDCNFSNAENGDYCDGGFLRNKQGEYKIDYNGLLQRCPRCGNKRIIGAGSFVEIPIPQENQPDLRNPVQMLTADVASLDYNVTEETRLQQNIINAVIGMDGDLLNSEAVNEKQVTASFESQSTILNRLKKCFEDAQKFVDTTICKLRYGNSFISANINLGTEFYTLTADELRERYKTAKDSGASLAELDALKKQIIETENRNNPNQLQRMLILADIEPYQHLTIDEVTTHYKDGIISEKDMRVKLQFAELINRFERENLNIIEFGTQTDYSTKIENIKNTLYKYVSTN